MFTKNHLFWDKFVAFCWHLLISLAIALIALLLVYGVWNPAPLYQATGITRIFLLMLAIDIILGPILTFLVYKKGKKTLKFDLMVIACLQFSALVYGMYHVYEGRPAWIVYNVDRFDLVRANEIDERNLEKANPAYRTISVTGAKYVASVIPKDDIELKNQILFDELDGIAPSQRPELYRSLHEVTNDIVSRAQPLIRLNQYNQPMQVSQILSHYPNAHAFLPLKANAVDMTVLVDSEGQVLKIVDLRPWD